jgi:hypothetical protein
VNERELNHQDLSAKLEAVIDGETCVDFLDELSDVIRKDPYLFANHKLEGFIGGLASSVSASSAKLPKFSSESEFWREFAEVIYSATIME